MDVRLPGIDGWAATRLLRSVPSPPAVVVFSGGPVLDAQEQVRASGALCYLTKAAFGPAEPQQQGVAALAAGPGVRGAGDRRGRISPTLRTRLPSSAPTRSAAASSWGRRVRRPGSRRWLATSPSGSESSVTRTPPVAPRRSSAQQK